MIRRTLAKGSVKPNTRGRPGTIYEHDFGQPIVFNRAGGLSSQLRVVVRNGVVVMAFPF
jgi:hypothetical protein